MLLRKFLTASLLLLAALPISSGAVAETARVAVAANFRAVLEDLAVLFAAGTGHRITASAGSTGQLYAQIANGAPYDVFMAADQQRPADLIDDGLAVSGTRITYARGQLVLVARQMPEGDPPDLSTIERLAIANPATAPYGAAGRQAADRLGGTAAPAARAANAGAVGALVVSGAAEAGFTAGSLAPTLVARGLAVWPVPGSYHAPIRQDAVLLVRARENAAALAFMDWLRQDEAKEVIRSFGYLVD